MLCKPFHHGVVLGAEDIQDGSRMVDTGEIAPDFTLPSTAGDITLSEVAADRQVVLAFYMEDKTPRLRADVERAARRI